MPLQSAREYHNTNDGQWPNVRRFTNGFLWLGSGHIANRCDAGTLIVNYLSYENEMTVDYMHKLQINKCVLAIKCNLWLSHITQKSYFNLVSFSVPFDEQENKPIMRTDQYNSKWLNSPQFVGSFEAGEFVYFVFREAAVEHINCGKVSVAVWQNINSTIAHQFRHYALLFNILNAVCITCAYAPLEQLSKRKKKKTKNKT